MKTKLLISMLALRQAMINPYFLCDTLDGIYTLAVHKDDRVLGAVASLNSFMEYTTVDAAAPKVMLAKELSCISHYIDLQKFGPRGSAEVCCVVNGDVPALEVAPLLLFSVIENAFMHGGSQPVDIWIDLAATGLRMHVLNRKTTLCANSAGAGLLNVRERLKLLYRRRHQIIIDDTPIDFSVYLQINLA